MSLIKYNNSIADCPEFCIANYYPLCGTDGNTYPNHCTLEQYACKNAIYDLAIAYEGECRGL